MPSAFGRPEAASLLCDPTSTVLPYIRSLILVEGLPDDDLDRDDRDPITRTPAVDSTVYWFNNVLPEIRINDLTALESLSLEALQWESLLSTSRRSIARLCRQLRSLQVVTWDSLDIPCIAVIQLLSAAPSLEHLALRLPEQDIIPPIDPDELPPRSNANATLVLDSFKIDNAVGCYLEGLPRHYSTLRITKLSLRGVGKNDVRAFIPFVRLCETSLQHLSLQLDDPYPVWGEAEGMSPSCAEDTAPSRVW